MNAIKSDKDTLMELWIENPDADDLFAMLCDELIMCGDTTTLERIEKEREPRCWLKAKKRTPRETTPHKEYFYFHGITMKIKFYYVRHHLVPPELSNNENPAVRSPEKAVNNLIELWNKCSEKQKIEFWNWNPPEETDE